MRHADQRVAKSRSLLRRRGGAVGTLDALPHPAALRKDHRRPSHCGIDVQPQPIADRDVGDRLYRVDQRGCRTPDDGGGRAGGLIRREIAHDQRDQRLGPSGLVERNHSDILAPEAGEQRALRDARMAARGRIDHERRGRGLT